MEPTERNIVRRWAFIASVISNTQLTHFHRQRRIQVLIRLVQAYKLTNQPLWLKALLDILQHAHDDGENLTHYDIKSALMLFEDACRHLAENGDKSWMTWVTNIYDAQGEIIWEDVWFQFFVESDKTAGTASTLSEDEPPDTEEDNTGDGKIP